MTLDAALRAAAARLEPIAGSGRLDAQLLLAHVMGLGRDAFVREGDRVLGAAERAAFDALVARRATGVPVAYLIGSWGFCGRDLAVDERVLVPRPETERVVEATLAGLRARGATAGRLADVGTGSGAIAIALAAALPDAWVFGSDISRDAVDLARRNAARNNVFQQCTFVHGDLMAPLVRFAPFDAVVANLPYVPTAAIPAPPDPVGFEPRLALDGGADGLDLYRRLLAGLPALLAPHAGAYFEAAPGTIEPLVQLVATAFPGARVEPGVDYAGLARFVALSLP